jgi:hypothetical protein
VSISDLKDFSGGCTQTPIKRGREDMRERKGREGKGKGRKGEAKEGRGGKGVVPPHFNLVPHHFPWASYDPGEQHIQNILIDSII